jgi:predicted PurR-regulated permease PerM
VIKIIKKSYPLFFTIVVGVILGILVFLIIKPFINALLGGIILAYLSYSLYNALNKKIKQESISALITTFIVILILIIPLFYAANSIAHEANKLYTYSQSFSLPDYSLCKDKVSFFCKINDIIVKFSNNANFKTYLKGFFLDIYKGFSQNGKNVISRFTNLVINFFVIILSTYFLLKDGKRFLVYALKWIPFEITLIITSSYATGQNPSKTFIHIPRNDIQQAIFILIKIIIMYV